MPRRRKSHGGGVIRIEFMKTTCRRLRSVLGVCLVWVLASACASTYYKVTDPATGKAYYTPKVHKDKKSGAVSFVDVGSGVSLSVAHAQVKAIKRQEFNRAVHAQ